MITIDGSLGEGGGQIVRSSLALAIVTGQPVTIERIRARRARPGLQRQHLAAVHAAAEVCGGKVEGAELGASRVVFRPGPIAAGCYRFAIGTAGSTTLVLQTILPALLLAPGPSTIQVEGGTHNPLAPPFDFLQRAFFPLVQRMGPKLQATLDRAGFYPAGQGRIKVVVEPARHLAGLTLTERGSLVGRSVRALVSRLPEHIGRRECQTIADCSGWPPDCFHVQQLRTAAGPGNVVFVELQYEQVTELFTGFGQKGVPAERVARQLWEQVQRYLDSDVPVGPYLADQLLLPLALAAARDRATSSFRTLALSRHATTHIELIQRFLPVDIETSERTGDDIAVHIAPED